MTLVKAKSKDGADVEVELPAGFGLRSEIIAEIQESVDKDVGKRIAKAREKALDDAIENEEQRTTLIERLKPYLPKPATGSGKPSKEEAEQLKRDIEEVTVKPIAAKLEKALATISAMTGKMRDAEIIRAAHANGVKPFLLKPIGDGEAPIVAMFRQQFGHDEESDAWYVKKGERFALSAKAGQDGGGQFMNAEEYFSTLKGNAEHRDLFVDERQGGAGFQGAASGAGGSGTVSKSDPIAIGQNLEGIAKGTVRAI